PQDCPQESAGRAIRWCRVNADRRGGRFLALARASSGRDRSRAAIGTAARGAGLGWQEMVGMARPAYCGGQDRFCPAPGAGADRLGGDAGAVTGQPAHSFAELLRQLRAEAKLTQEELAQTAGLSPRSVSNLERGINRTAHKDSAVLLAGALGLAGPAAELFVAAARRQAPAAEGVAAARGPGP